MLEPETVRFCVQAPAFLSFRTRLARRPAACSLAVATLRASSSQQQIGPNIPYRVDVTCSRNFANPAAVTSCLFAAATVTECARAAQSHASPRRNISDGSPPACARPCLSVPDRRIALRGVSSSSNKSSLV